MQITGAKQVTGTEPIPSVSRRRKFSRERKFSTVVSSGGRSRNWRRISFWKVEGFRRFDGDMISVNEIDDHQGEMDDSDSQFDVLGPVTFESN